MVKLADERLVSGLRHLDGFWLSRSQDSESKGDRQEGLLCSTYRCRTCTDISKIVGFDPSVKRPSLEYDKKYLQVKFLHVSGFRALLCWARETTHHAKAQRCTNHLCCFCLLNQLFFPFALFACRCTANHLKCETSMSTDTAHGRALQLLACTPHSLLRPRSPPPPLRKRNIGGSRTRHRSLQLQSPC
jgi:hypothetical protein